MLSLIDTMKELDTDIAIVTETWFTDSPRLRQDLEDMKNALGFACLCRDQGTHGGGVAIIYRTARIEFVQLPSSARFEIMAALGRRAGHVSILDLYENQERSMKS